MENKLETKDNILQDKKRDILFARIASNLLRTDEVEKARRICEYGLKKYPTYAPGHYILAKCYLVQKKYDEARVEFERVLRYEPNHLNALMELSHLYKGSGLTDIYKDYLLRLLNLDPLNDTVRAEAKSLGIYQEKKIPQQKTAPAQAKAPDASSSPEKHVDLSQFDNLEDDFETILEGRGRKSAFAGRKEEKISLGSEEVSEDGLSPKEKRPKFTKDLPLDREEDSAEVDNDFEDLKELEFSGETDVSISSAGSNKDENKMHKTNLETSAEKVNRSDSSEIKITPITSSEKSEDDMDESYEKKNAGSPEEESGDEDRPEFKQPKIVSQTLGEILVSQKKYNEALGVFKTLQKQNPDNENIKKKIEFLTRIINLEK